MKETPEKAAPENAAQSPEPPNRLLSVARFWASFIITLAALGLVSGLMLVGLFLMMGYHIL